MINFRDLEQKKVFIHFARLLNDNLALSLANEEKEVTTKSEAEQLTQFYWKMVDEAVIVDRNHNSVEGVIGMQAIMEDLINIVGGYLERNGFEEQWDAEDE
ncbi:MAG: hypothetical protein KUG82_11200 [Pseudomonadales bacterium]|nr:hypothetical protein [Pseudomonadales bacterium]